MAVSHKSGRAYEAASNAGRPRVSKTDYTVGKGGRFTPTPRHAGAGAAALRPEYLELYQRLCEVFACCAFDMDRFKMFISVERPGWTPQQANAFFCGLPDRWLDEEAAAHRAAVEIARAREEARP